MTYWCITVLTFTNECIKDSLLIFGLISFIDLASIPIEDDNSNDAFHSPRQPETHAAGVSTAPVQQPPPVLHAHPPSHPPPGMPPLNVPPPVSIPHVMPPTSTLHLPPPPVLQNAVTLRPPLQQSMPPSRLPPPPGPLRGTMPPRMLPPPCHVGNPPTVLPPQVRPMPPTRPPPGYNVPPPQPQYRGPPPPG